MEVIPQTEIDDLLVRQNAMLNALGNVATDHSILNEIDKIETKIDNILGDEIIREYADIEGLPDD